MSTASVAAASAVDTRIAGKTPSVAKPLYTTIDHVTPAYVRNTGCWAADLAQQLTCIGVWNSRSANIRGFTAVHAQVIAFAQHLNLQVGDTVRFVTTGNVVVTRTVAAVATLSDSTGTATDSGFGKLDSALPNTITPAKVLPANWLDYFRLRGAGVPTLGTDQEAKALVADLVDIAADAAGAVGSALSASIAAPTDATRLGFYEIGVTFDSGQGVFLILSDQLVFLFCREVPNGGPSYAHDFGRINALLAAQFGASYSLTAADLSGFTVESSGLAGALSVYFVARNTGDLPYALIYRNSDNAIWNGTTFVNYVVADVATYTVGLPNYDGGHFAADFPGGVADGTACTIRIREQLSSNGAPAATDLTLRSYPFTPGGTAVSVAPNGIGPASFDSATVVPAVQTVVDPVDTTGGSVSITENDFSISTT